MQPGRLTIAGSGIRAIGQLTLEAVAVIRQADRVFYLLAEPATELSIREQRPDAVDLGDLYVPSRSRTATYVQIAERMLAEVRRGLDVVGVFYGHPGFFVDASHRAIAIAREEGHDAAMLPGISSLDCLWSDLGVDPARIGCQTLEATDMLLRRRTLLTDAHVVVLQVGMTGVVGWGRGRANRLAALLDYLEEFYEPDFEFIHYIGAQYPTGSAVMDPMTIAHLREDPDLGARLNGVSTLYIPPARLVAPDPDMAAAMGLRLIITEPVAPTPFPHGVAYGPEEREAVEALASHTPPDDYRPARAEPQTYALVRDLALDPRLRAAFLQDPAAVAASRPGPPVAPRDLEIVATAPERLAGAMRRTPHRIAQGLLQAALSDGEVLRELLAALESGTLPYFLAAGGWAVEPADLHPALAALERSRLATWANRYDLVVAGQNGAVLEIGDRSAALNGQVLRGARFSDGTLSWSEGANGSSGELAFELQAAGPLCEGRYWRAGSPRPAEPNACGSVGADDPAAASLAVLSRALERA